MNKFRKLDHTMNEMYIYPYYSHEVDKTYFGFFLLSHEFEDAQEVLLPSTLN